MFDFYFQSGEFLADNGSFWADLLVEVGGTFVGAMFALRLYKKESNDDEQKEVNARDKNTYDKLHYFTHLVDGSLRFCEELIDSCEQNVVKLTENIVASPKLYTFVWEDLLRAVEKVDQEAIYHAYRAKLDDQRITTLFTDLDSINRVRINIDQILGRVRSSVKKTRLKVLGEIDKCNENILALARDPDFDIDVKIKLVEIIEVVNQVDDAELELMALRETYFNALLPIIADLLEDGNTHIENLYRSAVLGIELINRISYLNSDIRLELIKVIIELSRLGGRMLIVWQPVRSVLN